MAGSSAFLSTLRGLGVGDTLRLTLKSDTPVLVIGVIWDTHGIGFDIDAENHEKLVNIRTMTGPTDISMVCRMPTTRWGWFAGLVGEWVMRHDRIPAVPISVRRN